MKKTITSLFVLLLVASTSFAETFELKVVHIDCEKCVQKIHDYFSKNLGSRVQNLKVDQDNDKVTFDSISVDAIELENIRKGLGMLGFKTERLLTPAKK